MRRYESYKNSGVEWLGEVPSHWELGRISTYFTERRTKVSDKDYPALSVTKLGVFPQWENVAKTNDGDNRKLAKKGDFVINSRSDRKGSSGIAKQDGSVSLINIVLQPKKINSVYSEYLFKSYSFIEEFYRVGHGIVADLWTTRFEDIKNSLIIYPPLSEQQKIAQFLDDKIAKIDQAVDLAEKQIALLKEHKQILIQNTVTRGLNPDVPLKDSGVEWIGQVPEHWEVKQLKFESHITLGKMLCTEYKRGFHLKPYLKSKNIQWLNVDTSSIDEMYFSNYELALYKLEKGDLILSEGGEVGKTCMWNNELDECYIQNSAHKVRLYKKNNNKYFLYLFFSCGHLGVFDSIVNRVSIAHLTKDKLENMKFIFPTLAEQTAIADYLDKQTVKIDQAIALKTAHIEKLKEYKSVLINDVVTGKVRV